MLNENIKAIRKSKGLSQQELAIKLNVVRQTVSKWEQGLSVPDSDMLITMSEVLETPVEEGACVFSVEVFGGHEALHGHICHAVDPRQVAVALFVHGFLWLGYILDHPPHAPSRLLAFLDEATGCRDESPDLSPSVC